MIIVIKYKLFCTVTMKTYYVEADSEYEARKILALCLGYPIDCIDVFR